MRSDSTAFEFGKQIAENELLLILRGSTSDQARQKSIVSEMAHGMIVEAAATIDVLCGRRALAQVFHDILTRLAAVDEKDAKAAAFKGIKQ